MTENYSTHIPYATSFENSIEGISISEGEPFVPIEVYFNIPIKYRHAIHAIKFKDGTQWDCINGVRYGRNI